MSAAGRQQLASLSNRVRQNCISAPCSWPRPQLHCDELALLAGEPAREGDLPSEG